MRFHAYAPAEADAPPDVDMADLYRHEAARLRALAQTATFAEVRQDLIAIAQEYEALARHRRRYLA